MTHTRPHRHTHWPRLPGAFGWRHREWIGRNRKLLNHHRQGNKLSAFENASILLNLHRHENKALYVGHIFCHMVQRGKQQVQGTNTSRLKDLLLCAYVCVSSDPVVLGAVAALLSLVTGVLMTSMFCLHYTGFLCKLKTTLPRALIVGNLIYFSFYLPVCLSVCHFNILVFIQI